MPLPYRYAKFESGRNSDPHKITEFWFGQNFGPEIFLVRTKICSGRNSGPDKIQVTTNFWPGRNSGLDEIMVQQKFRPGQNFSQE